MFVKLKALGKLPPERAEGFPLIPPIGVPRFIPPDLRVARNLHRTMRSEPATLPTVPLRPVAAAGANLAAQSTTGTGSVGSEPVPTGDPRLPQTAERSGPVLTGDLQDPQNAETVRVIVEEVLKRLGHREITASRNARASRRAKRTAIRVQQVQIGRENDLWWKKAISEVWRKVYGTTEANDFAYYAPANKDDVGECNRGAGPGPGQDLRLDFSMGFSRSRWNRMILQKICDQTRALREEQGGWGIPDVSEAYIMGELEGQLKRSREAWALVQPRLSSESGTIETREQTASRVQSYSAKRRADVSGRSLRKAVSLLSA